MLRASSRGRNALRAGAPSLYRMLCAAAPRPAPAELPTSVDVVVVGGGIVGANTALSLAKHGKSVLVLEQNTLTSGATWHAAGLVTQLKHCEAMVAMTQYGRNQFESLEAERGVGWHATGSLGLARGTEHWVQMQRATALLKDANVPHEAFSLDASGGGPKEAAAAAQALERVRAIHPLLDLEGVSGVIHIPSDGIVNPVDVTAAPHFRPRRGGALARARRLQAAGASRRRRAAGASRRRRAT